MAACKRQGSNKGVKDWSKFTNHKGNKVIIVNDFTNRTKFGSKIVTSLAQKG
jgi:hypothetical protein